MTLDIIGGMILMATLLANSFVFTNACGLSPAARIAVVAAIGAGPACRSALYQTGIFQTAFARSVVPLVGVMVVLPPGRRRHCRVAPDACARPCSPCRCETLIGLNAMRVFGGFFLLLAVAGRLSGPFPYSAGWGDVITGLWAIPLAIAGRRGTAKPDARSFAWNVFGAADLIAAIALGVLSSEGFALQVFAGARARPPRSTCRSC